LEASGLDPQQWAQVSFYEGQGCIECSGTGFRGRSAIHELLDLSDRIREMILAKKPTSEIRRAAREEGMRFLRESALDKVRLGLTTLKEINKVTFIEAMRWEQWSVVSGQSSVIGPVTGLDVLTNHCSLTIGHILKCPFSYCI